MQADAVHLPFRPGTFDAVILNHSVKHFVQLKPVLQEIGRVIKPEGTAFVAVPDASTFTDRLYGKVLRSRGGHVNLFDSPRDVDTQPLPNVCIRCGQAHPSQALEQAGRVRTRMPARWYRCPDCGVFNRFIAGSLR